MLRRLYLLLQHALPHHAVTRLGFWITHIRVGAIKNWQIRGFIRRFDIDLAEAETTDLDHYPTFDAFFTRGLAPGARSADPDPDAVLMPADGRISATGRIDADRIYQAKNHHFSLNELLGDEARAADYVDGSFATVYLQPRNYHRVHMPFAGTLRETLYIPGRLYSVAPVTVEGVPRLFARNERLVCHFDTAIGPMALIFVGAMIVSGIETVWSGMEPARGAALPQHTPYREALPAITLDRFAEAGRFHMGSTAIVLFGRDRVRIDPFETGQTVKVGERLGTTSGRTFT